MALLGRVKFRVFLHLFKRLSVGLHMHYIISIVEDCWNSYDSEFPETSDYVAFRYPSVPFLALFVIYVWLPSIWHFCGQLIQID